MDGKVNASEDEMTTNPNFDPSDARGRTEDCNR